MSIDDRIMGAVASTGYPCAANIYTGTAQAYFVFDYIVLPDDFADDDPQHERHLVQLHFFAPHTLNTVAIRKNIRDLIQAAFMRPSETPAHDEKKQHYVFEFEDTG
jgi:hypothetical protein